MRCGHRHSDRNCDPGHSRGKRPTAPEGFGYHDEYYESERGPLYRSRNGRLMGVCSGLAKHFAVSTRLVRIGFIFGAIFTGFWPACGLYVLLGFIMKPEPVIIPQGREEGKFYSEYVSSRKNALATLKGRFDSVEQRIRRMEDVVTSKEFNWERRL